MALCRTCTKSLELTAATNLYNQNENLLLHQIEVLTGLWLEQHLGLPEYICSNCYENLKGAVAFRERCILAQQYFHNSVDAGNKEKSTGGSDLVYLDIEVLDTRNHGSISTKNDTTDEEILNIETESREEVGLTHNSLTSDNEDDILLCSNDKNLKEIENDVKNISFADEDAALKRFRHPGSYVCDECGRHFNCISNFKLHKMRHTGIKNHQCEICKACFYTAHLLKRHQIRHSDRRPYKCLYCEKTFRSSSSKIKHQRNHTNERPFPCRYCTKCFTSSTHRKDHEVVHTGIRNFHCDLCEQSFLRRTHLRQHYRSKFHVRNAEKAKKPYMQLPDD